MIKDSPTELTTIASDESLNSQTVLGYSVRSVLPDEDPDEIQELNESLRRSFSIREATEISSMAPSAGGETEVEKIFTNKSGKLVLPPDGDYGWVSVFCLTAVQFSTWGANAGSTSVLLSFDIDNDVFHGASRLDFAWIAGVVLGMVKIPKVSIRSIMDTSKFIFSSHVFEDVRFYWLLLWYVISFFGCSLVVYTFASYATALDSHRYKAPL